MNDSPVCIYQAANIGEAQLVKDLLQDAGIESLIVGDNQPYAGLLATTSVDLLVTEADQPLALEIVDRYEQEQASHANQADWRCPRCGANMPGSFDLCIKCGTDRTGQRIVDEDEIDDTPPAPLAAPRTKSETEFSSESASFSQQLSPALKRNIWIETVVVLSILSPFYYNAIASLIWPAKYANGGWTVDAALWVLFRDFHLICIVVYLMWRSERRLPDFGLVRPQLGIDLPLTGLVFLVDIFVWMTLSRIWNSLSPSTALPGNTEQLGIVEGTLVVLAFCTSALMEELILRSYFLTRFEQLFQSTVVSLLLTTILFAGYHIGYGAWESLSAVLGGLVYGGFFCLTRRIWPVAAAHAIFNLYGHFET